MPSPRPEYRLDTPPIEPPDHLVHQLADLARHSTPSGTTTSRPRRATTLVAAAVGVVAVSAGGAWASGALTVPGLPSLHHAHAPATPPGAPSPLPTVVSPSSSTGPGGPRTTGPTDADGHGPRHGHGRDQGDQDGVTPDGHSTKTSHPTHPERPSQPAHPVKKQHPVHPAHPVKKQHPAKKQHPRHPVKKQHPAAGHQTKPHPTKKPHPAKPTNAAPSSTPSHGHGGHG